MIFMNVRSVKANCDTKRNKIQIWLYALDSQFRKYMMVFNYCSCIKNGNVYRVISLCTTSDSSLQFPSVSFEHLDGIMPDCFVWTSVAPILGEQPDSDIPRYNYSGLKGSLLQILSTETSRRILPLHLWYFQIKVTTEMVVFSMNVSLTEAINGRMRKRKTV